MPFSTDTNWPQGLLNVFNVFRNRHIPYKSRYYGPYNALLGYALKEDLFTFPLSRQTVPSETSACDTVFFMVMAVLAQECSPVLIVAIEDDGWANDPDKRLMADTQMRQQYHRMLPHCPIPHLYGLSLLGTSLRVYCGDKVTGKITPEFVSCPIEDRNLPPDFLAGEWDLDVLSLDGLKKVQEIIASFKVEVDNVTRQ